jgi:purine-nucleoside phosphorylase
MQKPPNEFTSESWPARVRRFAPECALVLGSGLGPFVESIDLTESVAYEEIPGLPHSKVPGHAGRFVFGTLGSTRVLVAQGRVHLYEGHPASAVTAGIRLIASAGVKHIVLTNAAGSVNPAFPPGHWMALTDHLNLTGQTPLLGGAHFFDMSAVYSSVLRQKFQGAADAEKVRLFEGVYAGNLGPQYETPAEVRMARTLGADAVGMSTVLEAIQARALGLETAGFSCLTNWAAGLSPGEITHEEVLDFGQRAAGDLARILRRALAPSR